MKLGFSDANIVVTKRGRYCREQGLFCQLLTDQVAPHVTKIMEDGYEMEMLHQPDELPLKLLDKVRDILTQHVWGKPAPSEHGWLTSLLRWSERLAPWLLSTIWEVYPNEPLDGYTLIHGDPTLANLMMRGSKIILSDPMPRMDYRLEIPYRKEVDLGKLLQSAAGWEKHLGVHVAPNRSHEEYVLQFNGELRSPARLWAGIHLARLCDRAERQQKWDTAYWAKGLSLEFARGH